MNSKFNRLRFQLIAPYWLILFIFTLSICILIWRTSAQFNEIRSKLQMSAMIEREAYEISKYRALIYESIMLYRSKFGEEHVEKIEVYNRERLAHLKLIVDKFEVDRGNIVLGKHVLSGLIQIERLQRGLLKEIRRNNNKKIQENYESMSIAYGYINARLADLAEIARRDSLRANQEMNYTLSFMKAVSFVLIVLVLLISLLTGVHYQKHLLEPILLLHRSLRDVTKGKWSKKLEIQPAPKEVLDMFEDFNNMTESLSRTREQLVMAKENAIKAAKIKSDFLSNMSHDIRTPLNSMLGIIDILDEKKLASYAEYISILKRSSHILLDLVNDILDISKIEAGSFTLVSSPFNFIESVQRVISVVEPLAERKNIKFIRRMDDLPTFIMGDNKRVEQIMLNLLGNAVKFTEKGSVELYLTKISESGRNWLQICVADTGSGISDDQIPFIFSRFVQTEQTSNLRRSGTGLGLTIVKELVGLMKGTIELESQVGEGTKFTVKIPAVEPKAIPPESLKKKSQIPWQELKQFQNILLVDDSEENRFLIKAYLEHSPCQIHEAENGSKAFEIFKQQPIDLVFMDMQMPVLDGYEATKQIREFEQDNNRIPVPIFALSAHVLPEDKQKSYDVGCNLHLTKPVQKSDLIHAMIEAKQGGVAK